VLRCTFSARLVPRHLRHRNVCFLLIRLLIRCHEPSRRSCSHLAFVFDFVTIEILFQRWKHTNSPHVISHVTFWRVNVLYFVLRVPLGKSLARCQEYAYVIGRYGNGLRT
jgi:hypothetical protein